VKTDTGKNIVYVSAEKNCPALWTDSLELTDTRWIADDAPLSGRYLIRTRHTRPLVEAQVQVEEETTRILFDDQVQAVAPGQSVTIHDGCECLGGGIVSR
jgi:tRNA-specific 2-thiouridylase